MVLTKNQFLKGFSICVVVLALTRCIFPSIAEPKQDSPLTAAADSVQAGETTPIVSDEAKDRLQLVGKKNHTTSFFKKDGSLVKNKIYSVANFSIAFPDLNDVQLASANKYGVRPVADRDEAEHRKAGLVYVGASPYYYVEPLKQSIPYLVPRAAVLLHDIGTNFFDSLQVKGIPLHKMIVTSVMRSKQDIASLRTRNGNATENSCHQYGTTFDIGYNRYITVNAPNGPARRAVRNDTLKWVLSEVINDLRKNERCYVKYEVKQGCFHITVR
ncbi:MAG: DUF5715 family protein [Prevotellaceae bacterium]|nr:DUF5715 family protein [Prevotellaceae bacterium]MDY3365989.1 DUF5715 family protein [Prevotella sp.]